MFGDAVGDSDILKTNPFPKEAGSTSICGAFTLLKHVTGVCELLVFSRLTAQGAFVEFLGEISSACNVGNGDPMAFNGGMEGATDCTTACAGIG